MKGFKQVPAMVSNKFVVGVVTNQAGKFCRIVFGDQFAATDETEYHTGVQLNEADALALAEIITNSFKEHQARTCKDAAGAKK